MFDGQMMYMGIVIVTCYIIHAIQSEETPADSPEAKDWWNHVIPDKYMKYWPPSLAHFQPGKNQSSKNIVPTDISYFLLPLLITSISMQNMDFQVELNIDVVWKDERLQNPAKYLDGQMPFSLTSPAELTDKLWIPTLNFVNCKNCPANLLNPQKNQFRFSWHQVAYFSLTLRKAFLFTCEFDLRRYPFDTQYCSILIQLQPIPRQEHAVRLEISDYFRKTRTGSQPKKISLPPGYKLEGIGFLNCSEDKGDTLSTNCHKYMFTFERETFPHVMLTYIPSLLIVVLSWISFWLDVESAPPRVALGLTSLLTLSTQFSNTQLKLPSTNKLKALDVWMFTCIFIVFLSLIEYAVANFCHRTAKLKSSVVTKVEVEKIRFKVNYVLQPYKLTRKERRHWFNRFKTKSFLPRKFRKHERCTCFNSKYIDQVSRVLFPLAFGVFNLVYWVHYL